MRAGRSDRRRSGRCACHTVAMHSFDTAGPADHYRIPSRDT